ncbi:LysR family transcriptional regulator [Derxia lacustris]|uniref:LysR family transcriptional regulator n=1 Tax=Derxia lacustris TaxID=764842 RepID=UPI001593CE81|nr:LysR family transcriptional regulator [Derxia lacustris]
MALTLDALETLDAIDRRGSFAAAAEELNRVPSALTYAVRKLEDDLGVALFDRSGHRARLTAEGRALVDEGRQLLRAARDLEQRVRQLARGWPVELTLALDSLLPIDVLLPLIERFTAEQRAAIEAEALAAALARSVPARVRTAPPRAGSALLAPAAAAPAAESALAPTRLRVLEEVLGGTREALLTGRAHLAIGLPAVGDGGSDLVLPPRASAPLPRAFGNFDTLVLGEVEWLFCVAPGHALAGHAGTLGTTEIARHRAVAVADSARVLAPRSIGLLAGQDVLTLPNMQAKLRAQLAGLGCGWLPAPLAQPHVAGGRLVALAHEAPRAPTTLLAAWAAPARCKAVALWTRMLAEPAVQRALLAPGALP